MILIYERYPQETPDKTSQQYEEESATISHCFSIGMMTNTQPNGTESPTKSDSKAFSHNLVPRISIEESRVNSPMKTPFNVNAAEFVPLSARNVEERVSGAHGEPVVMVDSGR